MTLLIDDRANYANSTQSSEPDHITSSCNKIEKACEKQKESERKEKEIEMEKETSENEEREQKRARSVIANRSMSSLVLFLLSRFLKIPLTSHNFIIFPNREDFK